MGRRFVEVPGERSALKDAGYPLGAVRRGAVEDTGYAVRWPPTLLNIGREGDCMMGSRGAAGTTPLALRSMDLLLANVGLNKETGWTVGDIGSVVGYKDMTGAAWRVICCNSPWR